MKKPWRDVAAAKMSQSLGEYTFGSSVIPSGSTTVLLEKRRGCTSRTVDVAPRVVEGGVRLSGKWQPHSAQFFAVVAPTASR